MSQRPSACFPPPTDYAPKPRSQGPSRRVDGSSHGRQDRSHGYQKRDDYHKISFHRDRPDYRTSYNKSVKNQPQEKFYRNDDDDYFARVDDEPEDDDKQVDESESQSGLDRSKAGEEEGEEVDPLDAYMESLEENTKKPDKILPPVRKNIEETTEYDDLERARGVRLDIDNADDIEESYYKYVEERTQSDNQEEDERQDLIEYDKDGNILSVRRIKKEVEPLQSIDHSTIIYDSFEKSFYQEHEEIAKLTTEQSDGLRSKLEIKVSGNAVPKPVCSFAHFRFEERLMKVIRKSEYYQPTPIQAQAIPAALSGRNIIGIAMTGSGKTAAYLWPMIVHITKQPELKRGDGPIGLVLVPTRELALQVYGEAKKFSNSYRLDVVCAYGGGSKYEQSKDLEAGAEVVVATPGRMIDLVKSNATNLRRVTYLVLDEADRFFEMGFEAQVRSICDHIRPDRQTLLFSATFKHKVEQLARTVTEDPVKIIQKSLGEANEDVTQHVVIIRELAAKWEWLIGRLVEFTSIGSVLIFVTRIVNSEELHKNLKEYGRETLLLHGDMEQSERNRVIMAFKRKECDIMIATDVAARGLDISHIRTVINYDVARDIDTHIHRVGRTGRAGTKGDAYTLLSLDKDKEFAGHLVKNLESSNQKVNDDLLRLAMQSHAFRKSRDKRGKRDRHCDQRGSSSSGSYHRSHHSHDRQDHSGRHRTGYHSNSRDRDSNPSSRHDHRNETRSQIPEKARSASRHHNDPNHEHDRKRSKWQ